MKELDDDQARDKVVTGLLALPLLETVACSGCEGECYGVGQAVVFTKRGDDFVDIPVHGLLDVKSPHWRRVVEFGSRLEFESHPRHSMFERVRK